MLVTSSAFSCPTRGDANCHDLLRVSCETRSRHPPHGCVYEMNCGPSRESRRQPVFFYSAVAQHYPPHRPAADALPGHGHAFPNFHVFVPDFSCCHSRSLQPLVVVRIPVDRDQTESVIRINGVRSSQADLRVDPARATPTSSGSHREGSRQHQAGRRHHGLGRGHHWSEHAG
jgi:hypothetical protein